MTNKKKYIIYADHPPLKNKGVAMCVFMYNFLKVVYDDVDLVITNDLYKNVSEDEIQESNNQKAYILNKWVFFKKWRFIPTPAKRICFSMLFIFLLPHLIWKLNKLKSHTLLISIGADSYHFWKMYLISVFCKNPIELYVVDNFHDYMLKSKNHWWIWQSDYLFRKIVKRTSTFYVISPSLKEKYQILFNKEIKLILPHHDEIEPIQKPKNDLKTIVYGGGINVLYEKGIKDFDQVLVDNNLNYRYIIQSYSDISHFNRLGLKSKSVEYRPSPAVRKDLINTYKEADIFIIPYSDDEIAKENVSTSFPHKIAEIIQYEIPILIIAPIYSSIYIFGKQTGLPFVYSNQEFKTNAVEILNEIMSNSKFVETYKQVYLQYFSTEAFLKTLG